MKKNCCGNDLGRYCFVGAGVFIERSKKIMLIWFGNPAKQIQDGWVNTAIETDFDENGIALCRI